MLQNNKILPRIINSYEYYKVLLDNPYNPNEY